MSTYSNFSKDWNHYEILLLTSINLHNEKDLNFIILPVSENSKDKCWVRAQDQ